MLGPNILWSKASALSPAAELVPTARGEIRFHFFRKLRTIVCFEWALPLPKVTVQKEQRKDQEPCVLLGTGLKESRFRWC